MKKLLITVMVALLLVASSAFAEDGDGPRTAQYDQYLEELGVNSILRRAADYRAALTLYDHKAEATQQGQRLEVLERGAPAATHQALLRGIDGHIVGWAYAASTDEGAIRVRVDLHNFTVATAGRHGIHFHEVGTCTPSFAAAGNHFNPTHAQHGFGGPHAGDLPNIVIDEAGNATYEAVTWLVTLDAGDNSLMDADGSALIISANPDDFITSESGGSGEGIACGVLVKLGSNRGR